MLLARWLKAITSRRKSARRSTEPAGQPSRLARDGEKALRYYEDKMLRTGRDYEDKSA